MEEILKNISSNDLKKLRMLLSIIPGNEVKEIVTLQVFRDEYSNLIKQNRSKAYHVSVMSSFKHLVDYFGDQKSIRELGLKEIESFCSILQQKVNKGYRVYYRTIKAAFNKAVEWGYAKENYFSKIRLPKWQKMAPGFINDNQLLAVSNQIKNDVVKNIVVFAFYTGMRLDEIINLRWRNIDLQNRIITVGDEDFVTKGRRQRFIPMDDEVFEMLLRIKNPPNIQRTSAECRVQNEKKNIKIRLIELAGDASTTLSIKKGFVFCKDNRERFTGDYISKTFKLACRNAGIDNKIHFHSLRHRSLPILYKKVYLFIP